MVKVDLITGFLGVGKTTFIKNYIDYLKLHKDRIHIIENEFGSLAMDEELLRDSRDEHCSVSDLTGMCMCCIGKQEFINLLVRAADEGVDHIVVEPSGIYDVDEFFDVLTDSRVCSKCEIGSIITIVDPFMEEVFSEEVKYLMFSQLLASGMVIVSKCDLATKEMIDAKLEWIDSLMKEKGCESGLMAEVVASSFDKWDEDSFDEVMDAGYYRIVHDTQSFSHSALFDSAEYKGVFLNREELVSKVNQFFTDKAFGNVLRVKGFVKTKDGGQYEVNSTGKFLRVSECDISGNSLVVIGEHLRLKAFL